MICKFCQKETQLVLETYYCKNHLPIVTLYYRSNPECYFYSFTFENNEYRMRWGAHHPSNTPIFELQKVSDGWTKDLMTLNYHPNITPEQAINKLKTWLLFK